MDIDKNYILEFMSQFNFNCDIPLIKKSINQERVTGFDFISLISDELHKSDDHSYCLNFNDELTHVSIKSILLLAVFNRTAPITCDEEQFVIDLWYEYSERDNFFHMIGKMESYDYFGMLNEKYINIDLAPAVIHLIVSNLKREIDYISKNDYIENIREFCVGCMNPCCNYDSCTEIERIEHYMKTKFLKMEDILNKYDEIPVRVDLPKEGEIRDQTFARVQDEEDINNG